FHAKKNAALHCGDIRLRIKRSLLEQAPAARVNRVIRGEMVN
ncbi:hypothetical protein HMPREF1619_03867, partial [Klebsiella pneumoniae 909957]